MKRDKRYMEWREEVLKRDQMCLICHKKTPNNKNMNAHHLIPRNFAKYEYFVDNGFTLCPGCHTLGRWSAHKNPIWFAEWLRRHFDFKFRQVNERLRLLYGAR